MSQISLITISLSPPHPDSGMETSLVRMRTQDRANFDLAARHMGMSRSQLSRVLLVRGSQRILRELGITTEHEDNKHVDLSKGETLIDEKTGH
jgi:hypothetical protein